MLLGCAGIAAASPDPRQEHRLNRSASLHHLPAAPLQDGESLAAIDIGSNSFHMVVARNVLGQLRVIDRLRETVRLADGLDDKKA